MELIQVALYTYREKLNMQSYKASFHNPFPISTAISVRWKGNICFFLWHDHDNTQKITAKSRWNSWQKIIQKLAHRSTVCETASWLSAGWTVGTATANLCRSNLNDDGYFTLCILSNSAQLSSWLRYYQGTFRAYIEYIFSACIIICRPTMCDGNRPILRFVLPSLRSWATL